MCVAATNTTIPAIPFPFSTIANTRKQRPRVSLHHLPYAYELVRIHRSYTVYGISASYKQSRLIIRWGVPLLYVGRIRFTAFSFIPIFVPVPCAPYIYTLKLRPKVIFFSIYIYTIYVHFYVCDFRRLRGSYIGSLIIYIRYTYYIKGNLCIRSAASFLALREPRAVGFGLRPWSCNMYTYIVYVLYIRITYTINYKFSYFDFK